jgi:hypothetical protein
VANETNVTSIVIDMPSAVDGSVTFDIVAMGVNAVLEVVPPQSRYTFNLSATGDVVGKIWMTYSFINFR